MRLSIIIPICYESGIKTCLESVVGCPLQDMECILIDTLNTETTKEITTQYLSKDGRFKVMLEPNISIIQARNAGMNAAVGKYIVFIDSNESFDVLSWPTLLRDICEEKEDFIAYCYYCRFDIKQDSIAWFSLSGLELNKTEKVMELLDSSYELNSCKGKLLNREIIQETNLQFIEEPKLLQEFTFIKNYLNMVHSIRLRQKAVYNVFEYQDPTYHMKEDKYLEELGEAYQKQRSFILIKSDPDLISKFYLHYVCVVLQALYDFAKIQSPTEFKETVSRFGKSEVVIEILEHASKDTIYPVSMRFESNWLQRKSYGWLAWYFRRKSDGEKVKQFLYRKIFE